MKLPQALLKDVEPDTPKFPTADFAHDMAAAIAENKKKRKKKKGQGKKLDGVDLDI